MLHVSVVLLFVFFFKQKTAYEMRISDWSSDVCSSDLQAHPVAVPEAVLHDPFEGPPVRMHLDRRANGAAVVAADVGRPAADMRPDHAILVPQCREQLGGGVGIPVEVAAVEDRKSTRLNSSH